MSEIFGDVLVDSEAFMADLRDRAAMASHSFYVQAMTFEGDAAGKALLDIMIASPAKDKRLCVDSYSRYVINDHFVFSLTYLKSEAFRREVKETSEVLAYAKSKGVQVKFTNSMRWMPWRYPCRNHKKMVILDEEVSYVGGINFSDHNFEWHDGMLMQVNKKLGGILADDFRKTWDGANQSAVVEAASNTVYFFNGSKSRSVYDSLFSLIGSARKEVVIVSPYVSDPLLPYIRNNVSREVDFKVVSPAENNKSIFKHYLFKEWRQGYFRLFQYQKGMSHLKAILIDNETLIMGSSNFDFASYYFEQEVVVAVRDRRLVDAFRGKVLVPDMADSVEMTKAIEYNRMMTLLVRVVTLGGGLLSKIGLRAD